MPERKKDNVALMKIDERSEENVVYSDEKRNCPSGQFHFNIKCCLLAAERGRKMYEIGIDMGGTHTAVGLVDGLMLKDRVEFATDTVRRRKEDHLSEAAFLYYVRHDPLLPQISLQAGN